MNARKWARHITAIALFHDKLSNFEIIQMEGSKNERHANGFGPKATTIRPFVLRSGVQELVWWGGGETHAPRPLVATPVT